MKEKDIRSIEKVTEHLEMERSWLSKYLGEDDLILPEYTMEIDCPCCGLKEETDFIRRNGFRLVECNHCHTIYVNPTFTPEILEKYYKDPECRGKYIGVLTSGEDANARTLKIHSPRRLKIENILKKNVNEITKQTLLDIGCASGQFLSTFEPDKAPKLFGVEASKILANQAKNAVPNATIINAMFEECKFKNDYFDMITLWEVFEHLTNPYDLLKNICKKLKKGGKLFLALPNMEGFDFQILWKIGTHFYPPSHLVYFRKSTIHYLIERAGLMIEEITTPGQLDVDIVRNRVNSDPAALKRLGAYLATRITEESEESNEFRSVFQSFLSDNGLSSHMMIVCSKK